jgi:hypothetical protein
MCTYLVLKLNEDVAGVYFGCEMVFEQRGFVFTAKLTAPFCFVVCENAIGLCAIE